jgi:hypothetical protein
MPNQKAYDASDIRGQGWMVVIHNDYKQDGEFMTFWSFTKRKKGKARLGDGLYVMGEGPTDAAALNVVRQKIRLPTIGEND